MITLVNLHLQNASSILVPNGSISFTINVDATVIAAPYGFVSSAIPVVFQLDANGNILPNSPDAVAQIWSNLELSPQNGMGLGTYYEVQILDQNGARLNQAAMYWQFIEAAGSTVDISEMTAYAAEGNVIYYPNIFGSDNTWTGVNIFANAGLFTGPQMNEYTQSLINSPDVETEFQAFQGGSNYATDGLTGAMVVPVGATVWQADAVAGYINNSSNTTHAVAGYFSGRAIANTASGVWGINPVVGVVNGITAKITCGEFDVNQSSGTDSSAFNASLIQDGINVVSGGTNKPRVGISTSSTSSANVWKAAAIFSSYDTFGLLIEGALTGTTALRLYNAPTATGANGLVIVPPDNTSATEVVGRNAADNATVWSIQNVGNALFPLVVAGQLQINNGGITLYNNIATVSGGVPAEYATVDLTTQTAAVGATTLYAVPASGAGQYRVSWDAKVTTAATTGAATSTLGALTIVYTDPDGVVQTITCAAQVAAGTIATTSAGNSTTTVLIGVPLLLNCKLSTNITYAMAYASNTAAQMAYNLHIKLESL